MTLTIFLILFLVLSAFFSGMEMAFISSSKLRIELSKNQGAASGKVLSYFLKHPSRFIGTYLIGNNIALVLFSFFLGKLLSPLWSYVLFDNEGIKLLFETVVGTIIILIFGEFLPKLIFRLKADKLLHSLAIPFMFFHSILYLLVLFVNFITKLMMKLVGVQIKENEPVFSHVDLEHYIKETMHQSEDDNVDTELLGNVLDLREVRVRGCMIPRPEIIAIEVNESIDKLKEIFIDSGYSKILIYRNDIDQILGYVHHFDLHKNPKNIVNIIKSIPIVPETMFAQKLLGEFKSNGRSIALVVDEYGGTAGIVTFEDILEEIFGEIQDEHDDEELIDQQLAKNEFLLSGRLEIDYINENYGLTLPEEDDYETLSGYIIHLTERIPEMNASIHTEDYEMVILNVSNTKVETVKLIRKK